jgi:protein phosphatase 2C family protein 2/3
MAKLECFGGNPNCVIATPEIEVFSLTSEIDYILIGSDGIFDRLDNHQINKIIQTETLKQTKSIQKGLLPSSFEHVSNCCGAAANGVLRASMENESTDNLSVVILALKNFQSVLAQTHIEQEPD